ncbi:MAG: hypothetical protein K2X43_01205 [Hyphomonadaceae bacterium]|jgi:hypothetical protein|nr:hypothetical protein [Hyphomonadaceae bacterium]
MDDQLERIIHLEAAVEHGQNLTAYRLDEHARRLAALETRPDAITRVMGPGAWLKIVLAICLPLLVLLATGDIGAAIRAAKLAGG